MRPLLLWLPDADGTGASLQPEQALLREMGFEVRELSLVEPPVSGAVEARWEQGLARTRTGAVMRSLTLSRAEAGKRPVYLLGVGLGGLMALLGASALPGFAAVVAFEPLVVHPTLREGHSLQPLDLMVGLRVPVQVHLAEQSVVTPPLHVERLRGVLGRSGLPHQVFVYPHTVDGFSGHSGSPAATTAWYRARDFLGFHAGLEIP